MGFLSKTIALSLLIGSVALAADPDCKYSYRFTNRTGESTDGAVVYAISGATPTVAINNKTNACTAWSFQYDSEGLSALSIALQSAPATGSADIPGTFATFAGTTVTGNNPSTVTTSATYTATGYFPFLRINLASSTGTGSINITLNGWKSPAYISASGGGGGTTPRLDQVLDPSANKNFAMVGDSLSFTYGATTSTTNLFTVQDSANNTGTGYIFTAGTATGSSANPWQVLCKGVQCASINGSSSLLTIGDPLGFATIGRFDSGGYGAIYFDTAAPSNTNYSFLGNTADVFFNAPDPGGTIHFRIANGSDFLSISSAGLLSSGIFKMPSSAGTGTATFSPQAGAGVGATAVCTTSHICDSISGDVTLTTAGTPATGSQLIITLAGLTRTNIPNCVVSMEAGTTFLAPSHTTTTTTITLSAAVAPTTGVPYRVSYVCGGN